MTGPEDRSRTPERVPTRRRVVAAYALLAVLATVGLLGLGDLLRHDPPAAGEVVQPADDGPDPLREDVECPTGTAREGAPRPSPAPGQGSPTSVSTGELLDCPLAFDGQRVRLVGEVVGTVLDRGDHAWVQINDDAYADALGPLPTHRDFRGANSGIGARMAPDVASQVRFIGGPRQRGDLVEVVAVFHRVDPEHAEVAVLEVLSLEVLRLGSRTEVAEVPARRIVAIVAAAAALVVMALERRQRRER